jgi:hypothetical protein
MSGGAEVTYSDLYKRIHTLERQVARLEYTAELNEKEIKFLQN